MVSHFHRWIAIGLLTCIHITGRLIVTIAVLFVVCRNLIAMWHILAGEPQLLKIVFSNLLEVLSLSLPYQEKAKGQGKTSRVETAIPKAVSRCVSSLSGIGHPTMSNYREYCNFHV